jgi:hypothetical protein
MKKLSPVTFFFSLALIYRRLKNFIRIRIQSVNRSIPYLHKFKSARENIYISRVKSTLNSQNLLAARALKKKKRKNRIRVRERLQAADLTLALESTLAYRNPKSLDLLCFLNFAEDIEVLFGKLR